MPRTLRCAVLLLYAEAAVAAGLGGYLVYEAFAISARIGPALFLTGLAFAVAAVLAGLARSLSQRRAGGRGLALAMQLMLAPLGYYMIKGGLAWLGIPLVVFGLATGTLLLTPSASQALAPGSATDRSGG